MRWLWLSLLALGCGARSTLEVGGDASAPPPPPPIDAGTDAGTAPPPPPPMGCALGPRRGPYVDGAPAFVFSLGPFADPLADSEGEYVLGYAQGWPPDERGAIGLLDLDLNELDVVHAAGTEQVAAVQADTELMRFTDDDRVLDVAWLDLTEDGWPERVRTNVCRECDASFAAMTPVLDGDRAALTYESGDDVVVWVVPVGGGASPLTTAFPEEGAPHLARHRGGYVLATQTADRRTTRVRFLDRDLGERVLLEVPLAPTGVPAGMVVRDDDVLLVGRAPEGEGERLV
ncbi:MAG TPA: hypothetical protein RMH99_20910, partial [Sandaracinaceae bacterium LLY-WYZ-13_1]|nr:hypothetical protein [Sandaracinaceae bacterium LLY-WYZ-13_1]